jgi:hypothetical protein
MANAIFELELPSGEILEMEADETLDQAEVINRARTQFPQYFSKPEPTNRIDQKLADKGVDTTQLPDAFGTRQPTKEELLTLAISGGAGLYAQGAGFLGKLGAGIAGASGFSLSELINRKLNADSPMEALVTGNTGETTPKQAASDFGTGLLYEAVPAAALAAGGRMLPRALAEKVYQSALKPTTTTGVKGAKQKVSTGLKEKLVLNEAGLAEKDDVLKKLGAEVTAEIKSKAQIGDTIDPNKLYSAILKLKQPYKDLPGNKTIMESINSIVDEWKAQYGVKPIPVDEALQMKRTADQVLTTYWRRLNKGDSNLMTPLQKDALAKGTNAIRKELNARYPSVKENNKRIHDLIQVLGDAEKRVVAQGNKNLVPFGTAETIGVAKSLGGNIPAAVAAVGGRSILEMPGVKSRVALGLQAARENQGRIVPPAYATMLLQKYLQGE